MLKLFSTSIFAPDGVDADIEKRVISGGTALNGEEDEIATDGGGRWFFEITEPYLDDPSTGKAWRALSAYLDGGARPVIVDICDCRYQPSDGSALVPHSDGTPFSDDSLYESGGAGTTITAAAALRATSIQLDMSELAEPLIGGERFTIDHPTYRARLYQIAEVDGSTVTIRPPLREAVTAGTLISFKQRCVMRLDGDMRSPTTLGFMESPGARFVEHFPGPDGYAS